MKALRRHDEQLTAQRLRAREDKVMQSLLAPPAAPAVASAPLDAPPGAPELAHEPEPTARVLAARLSLALAERDRALEDLRDARQTISNLRAEVAKAAEVRAQAEAKMAAAEQVNMRVSEIDAGASRLIGGEIARQLVPHLSTLFARTAHVRVGRVFGMEVAITPKVYDFRQLPGTSRRSLINEIWEARRRNRLAMVLHIKGSDRNLTAVLSWGPQDDSDSDSDVPAPAQDRGGQGADVGAEGHHP